MKNAMFLLLILASPAAAVPPPPPLPAALDATQAFIRATRDKDVRAYSDLLGDGFLGDDPLQAGPRNKAAWLQEIAEAFANKRFSVDVQNVFSGGQDVRGEFVQQVMIVERVTNFSFGNVRSPDCCSWYRTETLRLESGKIKRIERSALYDTMLSPTGERTDLGRRTP